MYHMKVTTSLLADAATVAEGKLYVLGGGWDSISSASLPVTFSSFALALVLEMKVNELIGDEVEVVLVDDENSQILRLTGHLEEEGAERYPDRKSINLPLALTFPQVNFVRAGLYTFTIYVAGEAIHSHPFLVNAPQ